MLKPEFLLHNRFLATVLQDCIAATNHLLQSRDQHNSDNKHAASGIISVLRFMVRVVGGNDKGNEYCQCPKAQAVRHQLQDVRKLQASLFSGVYLPGFTYRG